MNYIQLPALSGYLRNNLSQNDYAKYCKVFQMECTNIPKMRHDTYAKCIQHVFNKRGDAHIANEINQWNKMVSEELINANRKHYIDGVMWTH